MRIVLQRVHEASVEAEGRVAGRIGRGICLLVGVEKGDSEAEADRLAVKAVELRIFPDEAGKMNLSLADVGGEALAVSQFTLAGSVRKGRRPSFDGAEEPGRAEALFARFADGDPEAGDQGRDRRLPDPHDRPHRERRPGDLRPGIGQGRRSGRAGVRQTRALSERPPGARALGRGHHLPR